MSAIAIVGAGPLGGELAFLLARRDTAAQIRLVDDQGLVAAGKALDIQQAAPIERFATRVTGTSDLVAAAGANIIVIADRAEHAEWQADEGVSLLRQIKLLGGMSVIICAGASSVDLVERGVRELGLPRERILGSAPEALAGGARALVALEARCSPRDVALTVLGRPPQQSVIVWDDATIAGCAAVRALDEPTRRKIAALVDRLWPPGPLTLAAAAAKAAEAVLGGSRSMLSAFVAPDDSAGRRARAVALPVRLGPSGIMSAEPPVLSVRDRVALETAMLL
jgi:malate dehydrogenase